MKNLIFLCLSLVLLAACDEDTLEFNFDVSADKSTINAGESVTFTFVGIPDNITFFSGEIGKRYDYAGRANASGVPKLKFNAKLENVAAAEGLSVLVSDNFEGLVFELDSLNTRQPVKEECIKNLTKPNTWVDVTNQGTWPAAQNQTTTSEIDLSSIAAIEKPVYIAFKWVGNVGLNQSKWTISDLSIVNYLPDGTSYTTGNLTTNSITNYGYTGATFSPGWKDFLASGDVNWTVSTSSLVVAGKAAASSVNTESWVISGAVDLTKVTPDWGTAVKGMSTLVPSYNYTYKTAGTYLTTFVAYNDGIEVGKKQIEIVVQ
ncbi:MAG: DUF5017 domain-containing protein [Mangrovibacterium sp.]